MTPLFGLVGFFLGWTMSLLSVFLILLVLVQRGRGGGLTGALGGPGGQSAFGSKAGDMFTKITSVTALLWIGLCAIATASMGVKPLAEEPDDEIAVIEGKGDEDLGNLSFPGLSEIESEGTVEGDVELKPADAEPKMDAPAETEAPAETPAPAETEAPAAAETETPAPAKTEAEAPAKAETETPAKAETPADETP